MNKEKTITFAGRKIFNSLHGFTLVELITVLAILAILAAFVAPEVVSWRPKMRLKGIADTLAENMQRAKMHAIKNNTSVSFTFTPAAPCPGGSYRFFDASNSTIARDMMHDMTNDATKARTTSVCLQASTFAAGDGFSSRGLAIGAGGNATISNTVLNKTGDPTYVITQSVAGGINMQKVNLP